MAKVTASKAPAGRNDATDLVALYRTLVLIRRSEERLGTLFSDGEVPGFIHLSIGQEAVSAGVMSALSMRDTIASTHRGHGHALAKGLSLEGFFAELLAKNTGLCRGRGGSMHVADMSVGMLGANGIVGAGVAIALGSALAHRRLKRDAIAVAFFGDGALAEGLLHECMNMAALWQLPLLFVCENNGWGEFLPTSKQLAFKLQDLAAAYGIPHTRVDGNDVEAVALSAASLADETRHEGPRILECMTTRIRGHFEGDTQKYRDDDELAGMKERDPVAIAGKRLQEAGMGIDQLQQLEAKVEAEIDAAIAAARAAPSPSFDSAASDVYSPLPRRNAA